MTVNPNHEYVLALQSWEKTWAEFQPELREHERRFRAQLVKRQKRTDDGLANLALDFMVAFYVESAFWKQREVAKTEFGKKGISFRYFLRLLRKGHKLLSAQMEGAATL